MIEERKTVCPIVNVQHNGDNSGFLIDVDLAGASKESVELDMGSTGFCVKAAGADMEYESCFMLAHEVKPDEAAARFESGLLKIEVPFKNTMRGKRITIQ